MTVKLPKRLMTIETCLNCGKLMEMKSIWLTKKEDELHQRFVCSCGEQLEYLMTGTYPALYKKFVETQEMEEKNKPAASV